MATTTERGYGNEHQRARRRAIAALQDGDPCCLCGYPMYRTEKLDLDHTVDRTAYRGLAHEHCNRADGARRRSGSTRTGYHRPVAPTPRATRTCEVCGNHYQPSYHEQRSCGRTCGAQLRNHTTTREHRPRTPDRNCSECGATFTPRSTRHTTCTPTCATTRNRRQARHRYQNDPTYRATTIDRAKTRYRNLSRPIF